MADGYIRERTLKDGTLRFDAVMVVGRDPETGKRIPRSKRCDTRKKAERQLEKWRAQLECVAETHGVPLGEPVYSQFVESGGAALSAQMAEEE